MSAATTTITSLMCGAIGLVSPGSPSRPDALAMAVTDGAAQFQATAAPTNAQGGPVVSQSGPVRGPTQAQASEAPPTTSDATADPDLVVTGERLRGAVRGELTPERTLSPVEVRAYGASSLDEVLQGLQVQTKSVRSGDSAPVVLLNGHRIANFSEIAAVPAEAIERIDIFPEELALAYGYRPDQKVVNVVLFERFANATASGSLSQPTDGARTGETVAVQRFVLRGSSKLSLSGDYQHANMLLESDREIVQPDASGDVGRTRTLLPASDRVVLDASIGGTLAGSTTLSAHLRGDFTDTESLLGTDITGRQIERHTALSNLRGDGQLDTVAGRWLLSATGSLSRSTTDIDTAPDRDRAGDIAYGTDAYGINLQASGPLIRLPAGNLATTVRADLDGLRFANGNSGSAFDGFAKRTRRREGVQLSLGAPILKATDDRRIIPGALSITWAATLDRYSDYGRLWGYTYGVTWSPTRTVTILTSRGLSRAVPTLEQIGSRPVVTPNVRLFDFLTGDTVDVTRVFGGNGALLPQATRSISAGLEASSLFGQDLTASLDYYATDTRNQISQFPILTRVAQAAFPDRFVRSQENRLLLVDSSPVNVRRATEHDLRYGFNFTRPFNAVPKGGPPTTYHFYPSEAEARRRLPPGVEMVRVLPGSPAAKRLENMDSRIFLSLYHTIHLVDRVTLSEAARTLDLLGGDAVGFLGGQRKHEVEGQMGAFRKGLGARLSFDWKSGTRIRDAARPTDDLRLEGFARVDIVAFCNLAERFPGLRNGALAKARLTLGVSNVFNTRPHVFDREGMTPIGYQRSYLDPIGRSIALTLRTIV